MTKHATRHRKARRSASRGTTTKRFITSPELADRPEGPGRHRGNPFARASATARPVIVWPWTRPPGAPFAPSVATLACRASSASSNLPRTAAAAPRTRWLTLHSVLSSSRPTSRGAPVLEPLDETSQFVEHRQPQGGGCVLFVEQSSRAVTIRRVDCQWAWAHGVSHPPPKATCALAPTVGAPVAKVTNLAGRLWPRRSAGWGHPRRSPPW